MVIGISAACFSILGKGYWHFCLPIVCCFPLAIAIFLNFSNRKREWLQVIACAACVCILYAIPLKHYIRYVTTEDFSGYESLLQDLKTYQDNVENRDIFLVDIPAFVYLEADVIPEYRYSFLQSEYEEIVPEIREDLNSYVLESCSRPVLIVQSGGWTYEQIGEYQMCALYYHGRKMIAVYEKE